MENASNEWSALGWTQPGADGQAGDAAAPVSVIYVSVEEDGGAALGRELCSWGLFGLMTAYLRWLAEQLDGVRRSIEPAE